MARSSATETVDLSSMTCLVKANSIQTSNQNFLALIFSIKRDSKKPPSCAVDWWIGGSLT